MISMCIDLLCDLFIGKLDPVIGRDAEIKRMIQILSRRTKNKYVQIVRCMRHLNTDALLPVLSLLVQPVPVKRH